MLWERSAYMHSWGWETGGESGRKSKRKGAGPSGGLGPGPGQPWQWLMGSDWAVLQCSGGSEPCSARETFQALSPLSGAIHPTECSPQGQGVEECVGGPGWRRKGLGGSRGQPTPSDLVSQPVWAENRGASVCLWVHTCILFCSARG